MIAFSMGKKPQLIPIKEIKTSIVGKRLSELRKTRNLTQRELAKKLGISQSLLCQYEIGRQQLYADLIISIGAVLEVSADEILGLVKNRKRGRPKKKIDIQTT
jgi:transcriptional regulator with XRE-family HTH domain